MNTSPPIVVATRSRFGESWKEWLKVGVPILVLTGLAFGIAWHFVEPAPPKRVVIATGKKTGVYFSKGTEYQKYFADHEVELVVKETGGSGENYKLLTSPDSGVDIAIVQGGTAPPENAREGLEAVAGLYNEPVMVFYRRRDPAEKPLTLVKQLAGRRIAFGGEESGVRPVASMLLKDSGISDGDEVKSILVPLDGDKAADALRDGQVDAAFFIIGIEAKVVARLMKMDNIDLMSFDQAHAYSRRYSFLSPVTLYRGSIDAKEDLPHQDVHLIASPAVLVVRHSTHQAIIQLLVGAAQKSHSGVTLLSDAGTFPSADRTELPVNSNALYFLTNKPGWLQRKLPFWIASLLERMVIMLLPTLVVLVPLVRMMPPLYKWRIRSRIYRWYKRVRRIDEDLTQHSTPAHVEAARVELAELELELVNVKVPLSYTEELYNLRVHVGYVRTRIEGLLKTAGA